MFDFDASQSANLDGSPSIDGKKITGTFPYEDLGALADTEVASWSATFSANGKDVGSCSDGIDSLPFPG